MEEEDLRPRPSPMAALKRDLRTLGIAELEGWIGELRAEIARAEQEIAKRRDVRGAAEALFRPRSDR
jgi:uncharacterized small protein (DUF1192 family)